MKFTKIKIENFRSFSYGENGAEINQLGRLKLIIGPNNSGKANIFRCIKGFISLLDSGFYDTEALEEDYVDWSNIVILLGGYIMNSIFSIKDFYEPYKIFLMHCRRTYRLMGDHHSADLVTLELSHLLNEKLNYLHKEI